MSELKIRVTGMTCGGCENAVTRALKQLDGVKDVSASHAAESVDVTFDDGKVTPGAIKDRIEALGYHVEG